MKIEELEKRFKELEDKIEYQSTDWHSHYNVFNAVLDDHSKRIDLLSNNVMGFVAELLKYLRERK